MRALAAPESTCASAPPCAASRRRRRRGERSRFEAAAMTARSAPRRRRRRRRLRRCPASRGGATTTARSPSSPAWHRPRRSAGIALRAVHARRTDRAAARSATTTRSSGRASPAMCARAARDSTTPPSSPRSRAHFGARVARASRSVERSRHPFRWRSKSRASVTQRARRCIGNAAQALHPVAGQGFNLGLRDAWDLARIVVDTPRDAIGSAAMLARYRAQPRRAIGVRASRSRTDLSRLFGNDRPWLRLPRGFGLCCSTRCRPPSARSAARCCTACAERLARRPRREVEASSCSRASRVPFARSTLVVPLSTHGVEWV